MFYKPFIIILVSIFLIIFSIQYIHIANAAMNNNSIYLELNPLSDKEVDSMTGLPTSSEANNDVKIFFTKTIDGSKDFRLTISNQIIDYGALSPTNPIIRENLVSIYNKSINNFSLFASEDHPLSYESGSFIPDTSCDNGACTNKISSIWNNTLTFGFGFRCENIKLKICLGGLTTANHFKQFANEADKEEPEAILNGYINSDSQAKMIYKVNTSSNQPQLRYSNTIKYILVPGY